MAITGVTIVKRWAMSPPSNECVKISKYVILILVHGFITRQEVIRTPSVYPRSSISYGTSTSLLLNQKCSLIVNLTCVNRMRWWLERFDVLVRTLCHISSACSRKTQQCPISHVRFAYLHKTDTMV